MPLSVPYPIVGKIYNRWTGAVVSGATISLYNINNDEWVSTTTNSAGEYMFELSNMEDGYTNKDRLYIVARQGDPEMMADYKHTVDTVEGQHEENVILRYIDNWSSKQAKGTPHSLNEILNKVYDPVHPMLVTTYQDTLTAEPATVCISLPHHMVHEGKHFLCDDYDADVDKATPKYWRIVAPSDRECHVITELSASTGGTYELFLGSTVTAGGTPLNCYDNNGVTNNTPKMKVYADPTVTVDGTRVLVTWLGSGTKQGGGGSISRLEEGIIKDSVAIVKFTAVAADTTQVSLNVRWYEVYSK